MLKNRNSRSPVVIFLYNKNHLINRFLKIIRKCNNFKKYKFIFYSDLYTDPRDEKKVDYVRKKISEFKNKNKNVEIKLRKKNFGLKKNIISGVNEIIKIYKKIIVIEDDLLVTKDFLDYMNSNLNFYQNKKKVFSISGYSPNFINSTKYQNFFSYTPSSWGWGTWIDRWQKFKPIYKLNNSRLKKTRKIFQLTNYDNFVSFKDINIKKRNLWAANFTYASLKNKNLNSFPFKTKVSNIGFDGSGQGGISDKFSHRLVNYSYNKVSLTPNIKINCEFNQKLLQHFKKNNFFIFIKYFVPLFFIKFVKKKLIWH